MLFIVLKIDFNRCNYNSNLNEVTTACI